MATTKTKYRRTSGGTQKEALGLAAKLNLVEKSVKGADLPDFKAGDLVRVHVKIKEGEKERIQVYEGTVIARQNRGAGRSFIVRKMSHGVGVERIFMENSPKVAKLEVMTKGSVRRAKLYYIRELEGKAAKIDREVETLASAQQSAEAKAGSSTKK